jgi:hypothetical protein
VRPCFSASEKEEEARRGVEVQDALARLVAVSKIAWTFDNLRPTFSRAVWPVGTVFAPNNGPVIHLSPATPVYGELLGEIAFWDTVYGKRAKRLHEAVTPEKARLEKELDYAEADYRRACARAWAYDNLKPLVRERTSEPAAIVNPLIPVPTVYISPASPTAQEIVGALQRSEAKIRALKGAVEKPDGNAFPLPPPPDLATLAGAWQAATVNLTQLASAAQDLQNQVNAIDRGIGNWATPLYGDLAGARVRVIHAQWEVAVLEMQISELRQQGAQAPAGPGNQPFPGNAPAPGNPAFPGNLPAQGNAPVAGNPPAAAANIGEGRDSPRTWTDNAGRSLGEAQFDRFDFGKLSLKTANGRRFTVPWDRLCENDQAWIRENGGPLSGARAMRAWTYRNGSSIGDAWFWGAERNVVKLKKDNGSRIQVPMKNLSREDQAWVREH